MRTLIAVIVVVVLGGAGAFAWSMMGGGDSSVSDVPTATVKRGPLLISVTEQGTLQAREQEIIVNEVEGRTEIISIVPEGTLVEAGDLLIELDSSELEDRKVDQEIILQNADAAFVRARENLEVAKSQATSDVSQAELDHQFAKEDLTKYLEGEYPKELKEAESQITLRREELERAVERREGSETLFREKYIAETELRSDELAEQRSRLDHELAVASKDLLVEFTYPRRVAELESDIEQTRLALERVRRKASADVVQAEADLRAAEAELRRQRDRLAKINDQIEKTSIYSPAAGMVIYATSVNRNRWRDDEPLEAGYQAREREELIYLPLAQSMKAEVEIPESVLEKVSVGQRVRVTSPAAPGRVMSGTVARVAPLPNESNWWNPDLKVYTTDIHLDDDVGGIRSGMSCRVEIVVEEYADALHVPVQAVTRHEGQAYAWVRTSSGGFEPRAVEIGLDNNVMVRIVDGLSVGEEVSLLPSLDAEIVPTGGEVAERGESGDDAAGGDGGAALANAGAS